MARRGRKAKNVKREPNGRASRKDLPRIQFDHGTARAQMKFAQYGTDGADAIGRAYQAGLLGEQADAIRDTARKIARAYWPMLEIGSYRCTLNDQRGAGNDNFDHDRLKAREEWLTGILRSVDSCGQTIRKAFDQLVIDIHPDSGPPWLEALIYRQRLVQRMKTAEAKGEDNRARQIYLQIVDVEVSHEYGRGHCALANAMTAFDAILP